MKGTISRAYSRRANQLLVLEGASLGTREACATAAGRVYDKLDGEFSRLLGRLGVRALFLRSGKLAAAEFAVLGEVATLESSATLHARITALDPAIGLATAGALFGTFFRLISSLIGDRLTTQVLRARWPTIESLGPEETNG
jgi:hypothetical protein